MNDTGKMQCDFTDLRINPTVASPRSQVKLHWKFANEVLRPEIRVFFTTYCLSPSFLFFVFPLCYVCPQAKSFVY